MKLRTSGSLSAQKSTLKPRHDHCRAMSECLCPGPSTGAQDLERLTVITLSNRVPMHMKRLASLFLLLVLAGSALAGVPLQFGENECSMGGMMDMDCCKAALLNSYARIPVPCFPRERTFGLVKIMSS